MKKIEEKKKGADKGKKKMERGRAFG